MSKLPKGQNVNQQLVENLKIILGDKFSFHYEEKLTLTKTESREN